MGKHEVWENAKMAKDIDDDGSSEQIANDIHNTGNKYAYLHDEDEPADHCMKAAACWRKRGHCGLCSNHPEMLDK